MSQTLPDAKATSPAVRGTSVPLTPAATLTGDKPVEKEDVEGEAKDRPLPPSSTAHADDGRAIHIVDWDGPNDPENPKKCVRIFPPASSKIKLTHCATRIICACSWKYSKKWHLILTVSCFTFISPISSSIIAPASEQVAAEFGVTSSVVIAMMTSVFVLAYGTYFNLVSRAPREISVSHLLARSSTRNTHTLSRRT